MTLNSPCVNSSGRWNSNRTPPHSFRNWNNSSRSLQSCAYSSGVRPNEPLPAHLPREIVTVELPEGERFSEQGEPLKAIGKEISEKFVYEPAHTCRS